MDENLMAKRKRIVMELLKGKQIATTLQTLLHEPVQDHEPVTYEELAMQILKSFTTSLSELSSYSQWHESARVVAVDGSGSTCSAESEKKLTPAAKDRRGCYKRRKTSDSWTTVTKTTDDGLAWRKYGQKKILNSKNPRCYFRCAHKYSQGCNATKQVQKLEDDPFMYQTTYLNRHTCTGTLTYPCISGDLDPVEPNLISFQTQSNPMKEEDSHISDPWQDIFVGSDNRFGYQEVGPDCFSQLDDIINTFQFD